MGTWMLGPRNTRAWHRFSRGQVGWVLKRYGFVVTQGDPQKVALLKGFITTIHWTLGVRYPSWKPTQLVVALAGRALVCASKIFLVCASNIFLVCASLFAFYHIFHRAAASLVPPLLARFYGFPLSFVRFSWFPWFPLFLCFPCGFRGFYNASPVSIVSMVSLVSMVFYGSHWLCAVSMVSMFSMVSMVSKRRPWFL